MAAKLWEKAAGSPPPDTGQEDVRWAQLVPAAIVEGTVYQLSRMAFDRGLRVVVAKSTGTWPGKTGEGQ